MALVFVLPWGHGRGRRAQLEGARPVPGAQSGEASPRQCQRGEWPARAEAAPEQEQAHRYARGYLIEPPRTTLHAPAAASGCMLAARATGAVPIRRRWRAAVAAALGSPLNTRTISIDERAHVRTAAFVVGSDRVRISVTPGVERRKRRPPTWQRRLERTTSSHLLRARPPAEG